jgi:hypothetical protein
MTCKCRLLRHLHHHQPWTEQNQDQENDQEEEDKPDEDQKEDEEEAEEQAPDVPEVPQEFMFDIDATPMDPDLIEFSNRERKGKGGGRGLIFSQDRGRYIKPMLPKGKVVRLAGTYVLSCFVYTIFKVSLLTRDLSSGRNFASSSAIPKGPTSTSCRNKQRRPRRSYSAI